MHQNPFCTQGSMIFTMMFSFILQKKEVILIDSSIRKISLSFSNSSSQHNFPIVEFAMIPHIWLSIRVDGQNYPNTTAHASCIAT